MDIAAILDMWPQMFERMLFLQPMKAFKFCFNWSNSSRGEDVELPKCEWPWDEGQKNGIDLWHS